MIPETVTICGDIWKVVTNNKSGGCFDGGKKIITIGTYWPSDVANIFLHEVIEAIFTERLMRYGLYSGTENDGYRFVFDHKEFENAILDIRKALNFNLTQKARKKKKKLKK